MSGASRGIGQSILKLFSSKGFSVIGTATSEDGVNVINEILSKSSASGFGIQLDLSDKESIENLFATLKEKDISPDIVVNNAGVTRDNIFLRHNKHKLAMSNAVKALNLKLFADEKYLSPSITAIKTEGIDAEEFRKTIKNNFDILLAGGQDHLKGKIFRVGHLGYINDRDIITVVSAISNTLLSLGKISAQQAGEALDVASKYLGGN